MLIYYNLEWWMGQPGYLGHLSKAPFTSIMVKQVVDLSTPWSKINHERIQTHQQNDSHL